MKVNLGKYPKTINEQERVVEIEIDPEDTWNLFHTLALIIHPSLKLFKEESFCHPIINDDGNDLKDWNAILDKMIFAFEKLIEDDLYDDQKIDDKIQEGLNLFAEYFRALWY